jgi:hypothetical protein
MSLVLEQSWETVLFQLTEPLLGIYSRMALRRLCILHGHVNLESIYQTVSAVFSI